MKENQSKSNSQKACVIFPSVQGKTVSLSPEARLEEAVRLAQAIWLDVAYSEIVKVREIKPAIFFGNGFLEQLQQQIEEKEIDLVVVDTSLTPIQQRNLEKKLKIKVIDRTALILEIFGERANTKEGNLQVELAHLTYQRSRLVRSWTHLERQRGGAGFLGGPGETQIELDRRIIDDKIVRIKKDLEKVKRTRELQRGARKKVPYPVVALVGYTNAGKSTLFNLLSKANVFAQDLLFATLDPTMRKINLPSGKEVILSDTVGFISDLPHELVMSFRATLEEVLSADIVVHVRDLSNPDHQQQKQDVLDVLHHLGLEHIENKDNYIELWNKTDLLSEEDKQYVWENAKRNANIIPTSAVSGEGCKRFLQTLDDKLSQHHQMIMVKIPSSDGKELAWLHQNAHVLSIENHDDYQLVYAKIDKVNMAKLNARMKINLIS